MYILRPTIRLIANDEAGSIAGNITNGPDSTLIVYAYEDGDYDAAIETVEPEEGETRFPGSVTSSKVVDQHYKLAFLAPKDYDIVVAAYVDGQFKDVLRVIGQNVSVSSGDVTNQDIDLAS